METPPDDPPRNRVGVWIAWAIVAYVVVALVVGAALVVTGGAHDRHERRFTCQNNLSQLGGLFAAQRAADPQWRPQSGQALFLAWRKSGKILPGQESVLVCPGDQDVVFPETAELRRRYDDVDLDRPPRDLCSYAVRDFERFPLDPASKAPQVLAACIGHVDADGNWSMHHRSGANVVYDDGTTIFLDRAKLGLGPDDSLAPGPASKSEILRVLCFRPGETKR